MDKNLEVYVKGKGKVVLSKNDFLAGGGEGNVYIKNNVAYKVYNDIKDMIPVGKIQQLSTLTAPNIIKPKDVLLNSSNTPLGYTMDTVQDPIVLCSMFTKAFKSRENVSHEQVLKLVRKIQEGVKHIHSKHILVVDLNEMNFLLDKKLTDVFFIDVNSYQTPNFPATVIMPSVKDYHTPNVNENSDWFSFGIVTFMMFTGMHPFKGGHPKYKSMAKDIQLKERMKANISVFNSDVAVPATCEPFDVIPQVYRDWYKAVFEDGKRLPPPNDLTAVIVIQPKITHLSGSNNFDIVELYKVKGDISAFLNDTIVSTDGIYIKGRRFTETHNNAKLTVLPKMNHSVVAWNENNSLKLHNLQLNQDIACNIDIEQLMSYDERLYFKRSDQIFEVEFTEMSSKTLVTYRPVANVLSHATQVFDGVVVENLLGSCFISIFPEPSTNYSVHIKELDNHRITDAKFENNVLIVVGNKNGKYDKFIIRFDKNYKTYDVRETLDINYSGINFVVLDSNICVHMNENEEVELFLNQKDNTMVKTISDQTIKGDVKLFKHGSQTMFSKNGSVYTMTMKKNP